MVRPETPPPTYEEIAPRPVFHPPQPMPGPAVINQSFGDPQSDAENRPPPGILRYEQTVGEWLLIPGLPPPHSALHQRRMANRAFGGVRTPLVPLQQNLEPVREEDHNNNIMVADPPRLVTAEGFWFPPVAVVAPAPAEVDLRAHETLPASTDSDDTLPPPGSLTITIQDPEPTVDRPHVGVEVVEEEAAAQDEQEAPSSPVDGARALEPVCNIFYLNILVSGHFYKVFPLENYLSFSLSQ